MYINTYNVPKEVLQRRIRTLDREALVWITTGYDDETETSVEIVNTNSTLDTTLLNDLIQQPAQPDELQKKQDDELRITSLDSFITSSGLVDRHLSTVNNNADRDALLKVICFKLGICDAGGTIRLSTYLPPPTVAPIPNQQNNPKK